MPLSMNTGKLSRMAAMAATMFGLGNLIDVKVDKPPSLLDTEYHHRQRHGRHGNKKQTSFEHRRARQRMAKQSRKVNYAKNGTRG